MALESKNRGYTIVEPPIYEDFNLNLDALVACLEVIKESLPELFNYLPKSIKYQVIALGSPLGPPYPVIGFYSDIKDDINQIPEDLDFDEEVEKWIKKTGMKTIIRDSKLIETISWETLKDRNKE